MAEATTSTTTEKGKTPAPVKPQSQPLEQATTEEPPKPARLRIPHCNC